MFYIYRFKEVLSQKALFYTIFNHFEVLIRGNSVAVHLFDIIDIRIFVGNRCTHFVFNLSLILSDLS